MLLMLRSRRATPIQDIVDGTTTEDRTDCRQNYRLRVGATEHLNGKGRARGERNRELGAVVCCGAGVEQKPCVGGLTSLDALDDLGPFALELTGILDRGGLGSTGSSNLGGSVGLGHRHGRRSRRGSRSCNGLRCRRYGFGRGSRSHGLGRRLLARARDHFSRHGAERYWLVTDTDCDWPFYEHLGLERLAERTGAVADAPERYFVYGGRA